MNRGVDAVVRYDKDHKLSYPAGSREAVEVSPTLPSLLRDPELIH
jgi:hypothetical protein